MTTAMITILEMMLADPTPRTAFEIASRSCYSLARVQEAIDEGIAYDLMVIESSGPGPHHRYRAKTLEDRQAELASRKFFQRQLEDVRRGLEANMRDELAAKLDKPSIVPPKNRLLDGFGEWRVEPKR